MKRIVSVSIGSSKRNHRVETELLGEKFIIERIGTDGDKDEAVKLIRELDGQVDCFGMGGIDLYLYGSNKRYTIKDAIPMRDAARVSPIVDGSGLKNTLERRVIRYIDENIISFKNKKILMTSAADRFGMADSLYNCGADITFGDVMFGLKIPLPIKSYRVFQAIADILLPVAVKMPFEKLYPTGKEQDTVTSKYDRYYNEAEIIAGDYLLIKKYMPERLEDKIIITNTVTREDIEDLRQRGVCMLITTTPEFNGRSFGTNVMEALLVAILNKDVDKIAPSEYEFMLDKLNFAPRIVYLSNKEIKVSGN